jgi:hypothetical protein
MIPPTQREALAPEIRLGLLFAHLGFLGEDQTGRSLGNIDDEELLEVLYHHRGELIARQSDSHQFTENAVSIPENIVRP